MAEGRRALGILDHSSEKDVQPLGRQLLPFFKVGPAAGVALFEIVAPSVQSLAHDLVEQRWVTPQFFGYGAAELKIELIDLQMRTHSQVFHPTGRSARMLTFKPLR